MTTDEARIEGKKKLLHELDEANGETLAYLKANVGGFQMNPTGPRLDLLIALLKEANLITEEQWIDFETEFQVKMRDAMEPVLVQVRNAQRSQRLSVVKKPSKLVDKDGRPIGG